jgi:hypothetical protein
MRGGKRAEGKSLRLRIDQIDQIDGARLMSVRD